MTRVFLFSLLFVGVAVAEPPDPALPPRDASAATPTPPANDPGLLNRDLPSWLNLGGQIRYRGEGQEANNFTPGNDQNFVYQRYRFSVGIKPTNWLKFYGQLQDNRAFGNHKPIDPNARDTFDLRQAWVDIGNDEGWWDLKVGRQRLLFGSERVVGASEWTNTGRVFDAAKLAIHHGLDRVDIFASSLVNNAQDEWDHHQQGSNLHGIYASFGSWLPGSKIEPYILLRTLPIATDENGVVGKAHSYTWGLRAAGNIKKAWNYETEVIGQNGSVTNTTLRSWAATVVAERRFDSLFWKPSLMGEWSFASGDRNQHDGVSNTFDQLYPTNHYYYGITNQVGRRNMKDLRGGIWIRPEKWLTIKTEGHGLWLASAMDGLYTSGGAMTIAPVAGGAKYTDIGQELDFIGDVKLSRYYDIGAQYGHLFAGNFINTYSPGAGHTFWAVFIDLHLGQYQ